MRTLTLVLTAMVVLGLGALARAGHIEVIDQQSYKRIIDPEIVNIEQTKADIQLLESSRRAVQHEKESCIAASDEKLKALDDIIIQFNSEITQFGQ